MFWQFIIGMAVSALSFGAVKNTKVKGALANTFLDVAGVAGGWVAVYALPLNGDLRPARFILLAAVLLLGGVMFISLGGIISWVIGMIAILVSGYAIYGYLNTINSPLVDAARQGKDVGGNTLLAILKAAGLL